jgi:hypothetical protein
MHRVYTCIVFAWPNGEGFGVALRVCQRARGVAEATGVAEGEGCGGGERAIAHVARA